MASSEVINDALDILEGAWPSLLTEWRKNLNWRGAFTRMASTVPNDRLLAAARRQAKEIDFSKYKNLVELMAQRVRSAQGSQATLPETGVFEELTPDEHHQGLERIRSIRRGLEQKTKLPKSSDPYDKETA